MLPANFHPAVAAWFRGAFPAPTSVQLKAWEAIGAGTNTLISAPTTRWARRSTRSSDDPKLAHRCRANRTAAV